MPEEKMEYWTMHFDGSKRLTGTGAGVVLISPTGERLSYVLWIHFSASHNVAEYEALLHGLRIAICLGIRRLIVRGDSQLVVNQVMKEWSCPDDNMTAYRQERCVSVEQGRQLLKDIHSGICGNHAAARTIVGKAYRHGFFWPTAVSDADKIVRTCEGCQFFARQTHLPAQELQTNPLSWPFAVWGLDMVGLFKRAVGGYTHLFVAIDKFSKWIEAKPVITITADKARDFFINIVHRFGVPNRTSLIMALNSLAEHLKTFVKTSALKFVMPPWHTLGVTDKSSALMARYFMGSKHEFLTDYVPTLASG
uniref:GAG-POL n=1 Tax=Oryza sativa subsp. japonica TaxID=39947 RepID=Q8S6C3_ORYSJ|nr:putative GAG-POL precursor [Oryza sativa Japonica Group]